MKLLKRLPPVIVLFLMALGLLMYSRPAMGITTTITITGYNIPDATHLVNVTEVLIVPLILAEVFVSILRYFNRLGDFHVTMFLFGIALGSIVLNLPVAGNGASTTGIVPLAFTIIAWSLLGVWWWVGGQGEGVYAGGVKGAE